MKWMIASDLHGSAYWCEKMIERYREEKAGKLILLGDILYHGPRNPLPPSYAPMEVAGILNGWADTIVAVRGNCDSEVDQMMLSFPCRADYALLEADGRLMHLSHGHLPGNAPDDPPRLAPGSVLLTGHTHVKTLDARDDVLFVNPGSTSLPKDGTASYAVYENGSFYLKDMDGAIIEELSW